MARREHGLEHFGRVLADVDHGQVAAVDHHVLHGQLADFQHAVDLVARALRHAALLQVQIHRALDLVGRRPRAGIRVHAQRAQHAVDDELHDQHDRAQHAHDQRDGPRHDERQLVGLGDGVGLGQHFGEYEDECGHDGRRHGQRHGAAAEYVGEQCGGQHGRQNVDEIVAQQDAAQEALSHVHQALHEAGALVAVLFRRVHANPRRRRQRGFRAREKARAHQQHEDDPHQDEVLRFQKGGHGLMS